MKGRELADKISSAMLEKQGVDIKILELEGLTMMTDYFVICTGTTNAHVRAIASHIGDELIGQKVKPWHIEGGEEMNWLLMDFIDVIVHIFSPEKRQFYGLERLWGDAKIYNIKDDHEAANLPSDDA